MGSSNLHSDEKSSDLSRYQTAERKNEKQHYKAYEGGLGSASFIDPNSQQPASAQNRCL